MAWNIAWYGPWMGLGKKSSETDILLASHSDSDGVISFAAPAMYPEKIRSLVLPAMMSGIAVVHYTPELKGAELGEVLVLLGLLGKPGFFAVSEYADTGMLDRVVKGTAMEKWKRVPDGEAEIRQAIMGFPLPKREGPAQVIVDASFSVKGVGVVVLGIIKQGTVKVYDKLTAYPGKKETTVKSIQKQDKSFSEAGAGDRVGLALKGVSVKEVPRGTVLSAEPVEVASEFPYRFEKSRFFAGELPKDLHLALGAQWAGVHLGDKAECAKELALYEDFGIVAVDTKPGKLRIAGKLIAV